MAPHYKLTYFDARGLAEPTRLIFAYSNLPYEDIRVTKEEWTEMKKTSPYSLLPTLEEDGKVLNQSKAIARYLAKKNNLAGKNDWESFQCDAIVDSLGDVLQILIEIVHSATDDEQTKKERLQKFKNENLTAYLKDVEKIIAKNGGHFVGSNITWADLYVVCLIDSMGVQVKEDMFTNFAGLKKLKEKLYAIPSISTWLAKRPVTEF